MERAGSALDYFAWGLNVCLCAKAVGLFLDLIPEDGVCRDLGPDEQVLGQSLERMAASRVKGFGSVTRIHCGPHTTPEVFYVAVAHAIQSVVAGGSMHTRPKEDKFVIGSVEVLEEVPSKAKHLHPSHLAASPELGPSLVSSKVNEVGGESSSVNLTPRIFIVQDVDRAPPRTLGCLVEMLAVKTLSAPPEMTTGTVPDFLHLPSHFIIVASSSRAPLPSASLHFATPPTERRLPDRLLSAFMLRIPIVLPKLQPVAHIPSDPILSQEDLVRLMEAVPNVHLSPILVKHVRDTVSMVRSHPFVAHGLAPRAVDSLCLAIRVQAALRGGKFAIPEDFTNCVVEVLGHRIIVLDCEELPASVAGEHPLYLARWIVAAAVSSLPVPR